MVEIKPNEDWEVLTPTGYQSFSGIKRHISETIRLKFSDGSDLGCTRSHKILKDGVFIEAQELVVGDVIDTITVVEILDDEDQYVYDLLDVENGHQYITNNVVSHNCAFVRGWENFYTSVYPTLSSGQETKMLFTSTSNGLNHFHQFWVGAVDGTNGFNPVKATWERVPTRDEKWKQETLRALNFDYQKFAQEYECEFLGSSGTLLNGATLKALKKVEPLSTKDGLSIYHPKVDNRLYAMTCDVSHGKGLDYSAFHVIDVSEQPYKQVCTYRSNTVSPQDYAQIIFNIGKYYNNAFVLVENNDIGGTVTHILWHELEYDNLLSSQNNGRAGKKLVIGVPSKSDIGIRMTKSVKSLGCTVLKLIAESRQLEIVDKETIGELSTFSKKGSSYEAEEGKHDDCVMPLVSFAWMTTTDLFKELTDSNIMGTITDYSENQLANNLLSIGVVVTGVEDAEERAYVRLEGDPDLWTEHDWNGYGNFSVM